MKSFLKGAGHWIVLLLVTDLTFILLAWLLRPDAMESICLFILLYTALEIGVGYFLQRRKRKREIDAVTRFLNDPSETSKQALSVAFDGLWTHEILTVYAQLKSKPLKLRRNSSVCRIIRNI